MCLTPKINSQIDRLDNTRVNFNDVGLNIVTGLCDYISHDDLHSIKSTTNDLMVLQFNIRGLLSKLSTLSSIINACSTNSKVNVILLYETWLTSDTKDLVKISGYEFVGIERENKKGGGVRILISDELHYKRINKYNSVSNHLESLFVVILSKGKHVICGSMYRPPNSDLQAFHNDITNIMGKIKLETHKHIVIGMDHNLDFLSHGKHKDTEKFINTMVDASFLPCITRPTRVTRNSATLIDNIFIDNSNHDSLKSCIILHDISDHYPSLVILENLFLKRKEPTMNVSRDFQNKNIESLKNALSSINWNTLIGELPVNKAHDIFMTELELLIEFHLPLREKTGARKKYLCEPWLTKGIIKCGRKQLKLYEKFIQSKSIDDYNKYKIYRSTLQKLKKN